MSDDWRGQLERLGTSFERVACRSTGVFHVMVEREERHDVKHLPDDRRYLDLEQCRDGLLSQQMQTLPGDPGGPRELSAADAATAPPPVENDPYLRDQTGKPHAVWHRGVTRWGRLEGHPYELHQLRTLTDAAARVFGAIPADALSRLPNKVRDLARRAEPVARRAVFGEVPARPQKWIGHGWDVGIAQYANGVIVDYTESQMGKGDPGGYWFVLLHRLGWYGGRDSLLRARRAYWLDNGEYAYELIHNRAAATGPFEFANVPRHRLVSHLGDDLGGERTDVLWASRWAIDELLARTRQVAGASLRLQAAVAAVDAATTNDEKGKSLEHLMRLLFETVQGFSVRESNARSETEEIDLVLDNKSKRHPWDREQALFLVECKNWSKPCGKNEVVIFEAKVKNRRERCTIGFFIAWGGFTETAEVELLRSSREGWLMVLLDGAMVREAAMSGTFTKLLESAWYESLRR